MDLVVRTLADPEKRVVVVLGGGLGKRGGEAPFRDLGAGGLQFTNAVERWWTRQAVENDPAAWWKGFHLLYGKSRCAKHPPDGAGASGAGAARERKPAPWAAALAHLARACPGLTLVQQNVDDQLGLAKVPEKQVAMVHGSASGELWCSACPGVRKSIPQAGAAVPKCETCDKVLMPPLNLALGDAGGAPTASDNGGQGDEIAPWDEDVRKARRALARADLVVVAGANKLSSTLDLYSDALEQQPWVCINWNLGRWRAMNGVGVAAPLLHVPGDPAEVLCIIASAAGRVRCVSGKHGGKESPAWNDFAPTAVPREERSFAGRGELLRAAEKISGSARAKSSEAKEEDGDGWSSASSAQWDDNLGSDNEDSFLTLLLWRRVAKRRFPVRSSGGSGAATGAKREAPKSSGPKSSGLKRKRSARSDAAGAFSSPAGVVPGRKGLNGREAKKAAARALLHIDDDEDEEELLAGDLDDDDGNSADELRRGRPRTAKAQGGRGRGGGRGGRGGRGRAGRGGRANRGGALRRMASGDSDMDSFASLEGRKRRGSRTKPEPDLTPEEEEAVRSIVSLGKQFDPVEWLGEKDSELRAEASVAINALALPTAGRGLMAV